MGSLAGLHGSQVFITIGFFHEGSNLFIYAPGTMKLKNYQDKELVKQSPFTLQ